MLQHAESDVEFPVARGPDRTSDEPLDIGARDERVRVERDEEVAPIVIGVGSAGDGPVAAPPILPPSVRWAAAFVGIALLVVLGWIAFTRA